MKKYFAGLLTGILALGLALSALAISGRMTIEVDPINIQVNGQTFAPTDVNGKEVPVFAYEGTTYAPLRALAEAYGLEVGYDAAANMATVADPKLGYNAAANMATVADPDAPAKPARDEELIVGDWSCKMDMTEAMNRLLTQEDPEIGKYIKLSDFTITLIWTFDDKGAVTVKADEAAITETLNGVVDDVMDGMSAYLTSMAEENGMTLDELMAASDISMEELAETLRDNMASEMDFSSMHQTGKYKFKDGLLYIDDEGVEYKFDGNDTLNFTGGEGMDSLTGAMAESGLNADILPLILKRI